MEEENLVYNIFTLKTGNKYGAEYFNILYKYCKLFSRKKINFFCFTDNPNDLDENIKVLPIKVKKEDDIAGWWLKLYIFNEKNFEENSTNIFLDADIIICNSIDRFFIEKSNPILNDFSKIYSIKDWLWYDKVEKYKVFNTSVISWTGKNNNIKQIWKTFHKNRENIYENFKLEQDFFSFFLQEDLLPYPDYWCVSFKKTFVEKEIDFEGKTSIIVFHGNPKPHEILKNKDLISVYPWVRNLWNPY